MLTALFRIIASTELTAIGGKNTHECFRGDNWGYRDNYFDLWLSANQPEVCFSVVSTLARLREGTFDQGVEILLGVTAGTPVKTLGTLLIERGHTITLPQVEVMVRISELGAQNILRTNGHCNFFLVGTDDPENPVSIGCLYRGRRGWCANAIQLGCIRRWNKNSVLLFPNLDTKKL